MNKYAANVTTVNVFSRIGTNGFYTYVIEVILDRKHDGTAVPMSENYFMTDQGRRNMRQLAMGCSFQIKWKNASTEWVALKYLKETNPFDVA